jgi:murein DD-endopeptidase MepM/ murein hydrolase activator NlpD
MPMACVRCGGEVDALREKARVVGGRVVVVCRPCIGEGIDTASTERRVRCFTCDGEFEARLAKPVVVGGLVRLRCPRCSTRASTIDDCRGEVTAPPPAPAFLPPAPSSPAWRYVAGGGVLLALSLAGWLSPTPATVSPFSILSVAQASSAEDGRSDESDEIVDDRAVRAVPREAPQLPIQLASTAERITRTSANNATARPFPPAPVFLAADGVIHPVVAEEQILPSGATGRFGADRPGDRPEECGSGHCGIDLRAPDGTLILAVRAGVVTIARADEHGSGGRYVKINHDDGTATYYFHLDQLRPGLTAGMEVAAGDPIATLGRTGVTQSPTHLHFAMTVTDEAGRERYVDPLPMIASAHVVTP